jgi:hypothetical protein
MAYTPELSYKESALLRRAAWALGIPMTKCMTRVMETVADIITPTVVCRECKRRAAADCEHCMIKEAI